MRVLIVCTANACRSIMAEAILAARLPEAKVRSVGLHADGRGPDPLALAALAELGIVAPARPSRRLERVDVRDADLILGMARHHVRDVVVLDRGAFGRTFALGEIVELATSLGHRTSGESVASWLERLHERRSIVDLLEADSHYDIEDPTGGPSGAYLATAHHLTELLDHLAPSLAGPATRGRPDVPPPEVGRAMTAASQVHLVADPSGRLVADALVRPGAVDSLTLSGSWQDSGERASVLVATPGAAVACLTDEPHGAALVANRSPSARAVVVTNAGLATRLRRHLDANIFCVPSALPASTMLEIVQAIRSSPPERPEPPPA